MPCTISYMKHLVVAAIPLNLSSKLTIRRKDRVRIEPQIPIIAAVDLLEAGSIIDSEVNDVEFCCILV